MLHQAENPQLESGSNCKKALLAECSSSSPLGVQEVATVLQPKVQDYLDASGADGTATVSAVFARLPSAAGGPVSCFPDLRGQGPSAGSCQHTPPDPTRAQFECRSLPPNSESIFWQFPASWLCSHAQVPANLANVTVTSVPL